MKKAITFIVPAILVGLVGIITDRIFQPCLQPNPREALLAESRKQDPDKYNDGKVKSLISRCSPNTEKRDEVGRTPLIHLATSGRAETMAELIGVGAEIGKRDEQGRTDLMYAAGQEHVQAVELLLKEVRAKVKDDRIVKSYIDARDKVGYTALMMAAGDGHAETIRALLEARANIQARYAGGRTALMWAAEEEGQAEAIKVLLKAGADKRAMANKGHPRFQEIAELLRPY